MGDFSLAMLKSSLPHFCIYSIQHNSSCDQQTASETGECNLVNAEVSARLTDRNLEITYCIS